MAQGLLREVHVWVVLLLACTEDREPPAASECVGTFVETELFSGTLVAEGFHRVDARGHVLEEWQHDHVNALQERIVRTWSGELLVEERRDLDDDGMVDERVTYRYASERLVSSETERRWAGTSTESWAYDDEGNPLRATFAVDGVFSSMIDWVWEAGRTVSSELRDSEDRVLSQSDYAYDAPPPALDHTEIERTGLNGVPQEYQSVRRYAPDGLLVDERVSLEGEEVSSTAQVWSDGVLVERHTTRVLFGTTSTTTERWAYGDAGRLETYWRTMVADLEQPNSKPWWRRFGRGVVPRSEGAAQPATNGSARDRSIPA